MTAVGTGKCACGRTISGNKPGCRECLSKPVAPGNGVLEILNVQGGDVKIAFDKGDPAETIRCKRIIEDMLRRGYALVVEVERDGERKYERVQEFDAERGEYIIADFDSYEAAKVDASTSPEVKDVVATTEEPKQRGRPRKSLPMESTRATAVGRSAGG